MKIKHIVLLLVAVMSQHLQAQNNHSVFVRDSTYMELDFDGEDCVLTRNFDFADNGVKRVEYVSGAIPRARVEGTSNASVPVISLAPSNSGNAMQYTLGAQKKGDYKARSEHYLFIGDYYTTYVSQFSMRLDPAFTPVDKRGVGKSQWCILKQWHQSAPESPAISLSIMPGTNDKLIFSVKYGDDRENHQTMTSTPKVFKLGEWYNFRVEWRIAPARTDGVCRVWVSEVKQGERLGDKDLWFDYKGQIGYALRVGNFYNGTPVSHNIREHQGLYQSSHFSPESYHAVMFDNVKIYKPSHQPLAANN